MSTRKPTSWRKRAYKRIALRDGSVCAQCGVVEAWTYRKGGCCGSFERGGHYQIVHRCSTLELDHKVPLHTGGSNDDENLWLLCVSCHRAKTTKEHSNRLKRLFAEARVA